MIAFIHQNFKNNVSKPQFEYGGCPYTLPINSNSFKPYFYYFSNKTPFWHFLPKLLDNFLSNIDNFFQFLTNDPITLQNGSTWSQMVINDLIKIKHTQTNLEPKDWQKICFWGSWCPCTNFFIPLSSLPTYLCCLCLSSLLPIPII